VSKKNKKTLFAIRIPVSRSERAREWVLASAILIVFFGILGLVLVSRKIDCTLYAPKLSFQDCLFLAKWKPENIVP